MHTHEMVEETSPSGATRSIWNPTFSSSTIPKAIARSLKHSADRSDRRKSSPYRSAMSMLTLLRQSRRQESAKETVKVLRSGKGRTAGRVRTIGGAAHG